MSKQFRSNSSTALLYSVSNRFLLQKEKEETQKTPKGINVILALVIFAESPSSQDVIGVKELVRFAYAFCNILRTVTYYKGRFLLFKIILPF